jgi:hypothetical protein
MITNKKACLRCRLTRLKEFGFSEDDLKIMQNGFNHDWKYGHVFCYKWLGRVSIKRCPPDGCPYILEQMVSQDVK